MRPLAVAMEAGAVAVVVVVGWAEVENVRRRRRDRNDIVLRFKGLENSGEETTSRSSEAGRAGSRV